MKQIIINIPDNCELKQEGDTYTVVEREKLNYDDITEKLFRNKRTWWICSSGIIEGVCSDVFSRNANNCTSRKQAEKLLATNKLMIVAKYLNGDWQPDWDYRHQKKYYISLDHTANSLQIDYIDYTESSQYCNIYFESKELAEQAIEILGEDTIRLALCTDY